MSLVTRAYVMSRRKHRSSSLPLACALLAGTPSTAVHALQPLDAFLQGARKANHDNREANATSTQRLAEADVSQAKLYPVFTASGTYTFNQYEVAFPVALDPTNPDNVTNLVIQPQHQLDANLQISVPLVDFSAWRRISAANATAEAARAQARSMQLDVESVVYRAYYQLLGQEAVLGAAKRTADTLRKNLEQVQIKVEGGTASGLDVQRARAEIARAEVDIATADFAVVTARRQLETASFVAPEPASEFAPDDLHAEQPIETWLGRAGSTPRVAAAESAQRAATKTAAAAELQWLPTLTATAQERLTNATSFVGRNNVFLIQATLAWRFDPSLPANIRAQGAAVEAQHVRAERAERAAYDGIFQAWHQVRSSIEKARASRVQIEASDMAAELARDRYAAGAATQLDVVQAEQEAFRAQVASIQADTELAYARATLRANAGLLSEEVKKPSTEGRAQ